MSAAAARPAGSGWCYMSIGSNTGGRAGAYVTEARSLGSGVLPTHRHPPLQACTPVAIPGQPRTSLPQDLRTAPYASFEPELQGPHFGHISTGSTFTQVPATGKTWRTAAEASRAAPRRRLLRTRRGSAVSHNVCLRSKCRLGAQRHGLACREVANAFSRPGEVAKRQLDKALQLLGHLPWRFRADSGPSLGACPALRGLHGWRRLAADVKWCANRRCGIGRLRPTPLSVSPAEADVL